MSKINKNSAAKRLAAGTIVTALAVPLTGLAATPAFADEGVDNQNTANEVQETSETPVESATQAVEAAAENVDETREILEDAKETQSEALAKEAEAQTEVDEAQAEVDTARQGVIDAANEAGIEAAKDAVVQAEEAHANAINDEEEANDAVALQEDVIVDSKQAVVDAEGEVVIAKDESEAATAHADNYDLDAAVQAHIDANVAHDANLADKAAKEQELSDALTNLNEAVAERDLMTGIATQASDPAVVEAARLLAEQASDDVMLAEDKVADKIAVEQAARVSYNNALAALNTAEAKSDTTAGELAALQSTLDQASNALSIASADLLITENALDAALAAKVAADAILDGSETRAATAATVLADAAAERSAALAVLTNAETHAETLRLLAESFDQVQELNAAGYFQSVNATSAYKVLTDANATRHLDRVDLNAAWSATSIDNLVKALSYIEEANSIRQSLGLPEYQVSDTLMAIAIANTDGVRSDIRHLQQFGGIAENLAWGYGAANSSNSPFVGWYDQEKVIWDAAVANNPALSTMTAYQVSQQYPGLWSDVGHYLILINPTYTITGFGFSPTGGSYGTSFGQVFTTSTGAPHSSASGESFNHGRVLSVSDYLASVQAFISSNNKSPEAIAAEEAYAEALLELQAANDRLANADSSLAAAEAESIAAAAERVQAENDAIEADRVLGAAIIAVIGSNEAMDAATLAYDAAAAAYNAKNTEHLANQAELLDAQTTFATETDVLETAQASLAEAQSELEDAQAAQAQADDTYDRLVNAAARLATAEAELVTAQDSFDAAEQALDEVNARFVLSELALESATDDLAEAQAAHDAAFDAEEALAIANANLEAAQTAVEEAESLLETLQAAAVNAGEAILLAEAAVNDAEALVIQLEEAAAENLPDAEAALLAAEESLEQARFVLSQLADERILADEEVAAAFAAYEIALQELAVAEALLQSLVDAENAANNNTEDNTSPAAAGNSIDRLAETGGSDLSGLLLAGTLTIALGASMLLVSNRRQRATA